MGDRVYKIAISSGLSCPTRDGSLGTQGCAFCDLRGSSSYFGTSQSNEATVTDIGEQLRSRMEAVSNRFGVQKFLAYFQSYTNTHAGPEHLRQLYSAALRAPGVCGLCIGSRPDCIPDPVLEMLEELAAKSYVSLELGVQSFNDSTLLWLERGHDRQCSIDAFERIKRLAPHLQICVHLIFGAPTDPQHTAREAAKILNESGIHGAKLHQLMILRNTRLADRWQKENFPTLSIEEYTEQAIEFVEHLSPEIYLERLYATAPHPKECLAPLWSQKRWIPHNRMREIMEARGCVQGRLFQG